MPELKENKAQMQNIPFDVAEVVQNPRLSGLVWKSAERANIKVKQGRRTQRGRDPGLKKNPHAVSPL